jgi:hypothetical protein
VLVTNTAVGSITTNNYTLNGGFNYVNPLLPIGGGLITSLQMGNIPDFSYVYVWSPGAQSYTGSESYQGTWYDVTGSFTVPEPTVSVAAAFYVQAASTFTWTVTYTNN